MRWKIYESKEGTAKRKCKKTKKYSFAHGFPLFPMSNPLLDLFTPGKIGGTGAAPRLFSPVPRPFLFVPIIPCATAWRRHFQE
ncbi:MAG: hypothetical protein ACYC9O_07245 [Candidatus Latescibacterota bacterium]